VLRRYSDAFGFLTVIPLFKSRAMEDAELARSMAAFPLVGATLGLALALLHHWLFHRLPPPLEGALIVCLLAWATGGFHLDGVADTADGLGGSLNRVRSLEIMKDSRIGALGAIALIAVMLLKAAGYGYLPAQLAVPALICTPAIGRGLAVYMAFGVPYARASGGLGKPYAEQLSWPTMTAALLFAALLSLLAGWRGAAAFGATLLWVIILKYYFNRRLGGITGDILGFAEETGEAIFLVSLQLFL